MRLAIAHAIDAKGINQAAFNGDGVLTNQIFNESSPAYDEALNSAYAYDPALSKRLLAEAGYPNGFTLTMPGGGLMTPAIQTALQKQLAAVGITLKYTNVPGREPLRGHGVGQARARLRVLRLRSDRLVRGAELPHHDVDVEPEQDERPRD